MKKLEKIDNAKSQLNRDVFKQLRGRACRRRDKSISDKLHQVHTPWDKRKTPNSIHIPGTVLFDLTQDKKPMKKTEKEKWEIDMLVSIKVKEKESEEQYYSEEEWGDILFAKELAIRDAAEKNLNKKEEK